MFDVEEREQLTSDLVQTAGDDPRITAAAVLGSGALNQEDRWSDVDLALCLTAGADRAEAISAWTERMYQRHHAVHHLDVAAAAATYRVFLLESGLQIDLSFWSTANFRPTGPKFRLLFGAAGPPTPPAPPVAEHILGMGWLYSLHARSSIERGRRWQAEYMLSGARDQVLALACLRHDLSARQGRGIDELPAHVTEAASHTLIGTLASTELRRALASLTQLLLDEARYLNRQLADRLSVALSDMLL